MKRYHHWAILAAVVLLGYGVSPAVAQGPAVPSTTGPRLALLDVSKIFKNHQRFKGMMEDMKGRRRKG